MTEQEVKLLADVTIKTLVQRDFIAQILATLANREENPLEFLSKFTALTDTRLSDPPQDISLADVERLRSEADWIIHEAIDLVQGRLAP